MLCLAVEILGVVGTVKIAQRMVFIAVHVNCIEPHPLALVLAGSQSEVGSAHTGNLSLSSLENQSNSTKHKTARLFFTVRTGNHGGNANLGQLKLEVYPSPLV